MRLPSANPFLAPDGLARSLNRAVVAALPGDLGTPDVLGKRASDLLSSRALLAIALDEGNPLGLDPADPDLPRRLDACLAQEETAPAARVIARRFGRRLGCLLVMLRRGDPANRATRPEWTAAHWAFWAEMRQVVVGGGLMSGRLGEVALASAAATLAEAGIAGLRLERTPFGRWLPLVGLARCATREAKRALVFDFGETSVKRGLVAYDDGAPSRLTVLPVRPSPCAVGRDAPAARWAAMRELMLASHDEMMADGDAASAVLLCVASHMHDGHPLLTDQGCYGALQRLGPHLQTFMRDELAAAVGRSMQVTLMHDGTAAAAAYAGSPGTAVLVLGTSIGVGYTDGLDVAQGPAAALALQT